MLSCLVPRFGQEDKTMPSSAAFSLQFPLLSTAGKDDNSPSNYFISCTQCHQGLPGFQALKEHIDTMHPVKSDDLHEHRMNNGNLASSSSSPIPTSNAHKHSHLPSASSLSASTSISSQMHDERGRSTSPCTSDGAYACSQCSASFPNRDLLEKHELLHSPNALVSCKICHKTFANVYRLQRHMISHDESALLRKFKCTDCDKAFKFKHHLKEHIRIHSGEKPFGCNNCGKRFSHSGSYSSHMTSKKCISMGLKLNNRSIKIEKSLSGGHNSGAQKRAFLPPTLPVGSNNNNSSNSPNNNAFMPMLTKYNNYEAMNAAFLASFQNLQNPFYPIGPLDPRTSALNPYSIHSLLQLTSASHTMDLINKASNNHLKNETPSLHSDPEDMIEEVTEDVSDEPNKLVMDLGDDEDKSVRDSRSSTSPSPILNNGNLSTYNSIMETVNASVSHNLNLQENAKHLEFQRQLTPDMRRPSYSPSQSEEKDDSKEEESLVCSQCDKKFNHKTELAQHEKVLCGMFRKHEQSVENVANNSNYHIPMHSGSEDDGEDVNKLSSDSERKVRVRTAISEEQQLMLKEHYSLNSRPNREEFRTIAQRLQLDPRVVQVWFQNNRSRERKLNNIGYLKQSFAQQPSIRSSSASPAYSPLMDDQPLDLSLKKESLHSTPSSSPRYGTAPQQNDSPATTDEVMNLSRKSSRSPTPYRSMHYYGAAMSDRGEHFPRHTPSPNEAVPRYTPYILPGAASALGLVPMERLLQMTPEMARNPLMGLKSESLSPGSEKRSWKCEESRSSHEDDMHMIHLQKRPSLKQEPEVEGQFICDQCDKAFSKQSSLARHKYEHSGQRPYKCLECPKAFKHKHHLTEHKRLHSGEKPFQCCKCLKRFSHSGSYSQHMNHRYSYCKPYRD